MSVRVVASRDLTPAEVPGHSFRIIADGDATGGAYSLTEASSPVGAMVPPHAHDDAVECFYVMSGTYRMTVSGRVHEAEPGGFVLVPRGSPHNFEVVGTEPARAAVLFAPAGFESVFRSMPEIFGTPGEPGPLWTAINARHGTRLVEPGDDIGRPVVVASTGSSGPLVGPGETETAVSVGLWLDPTYGRPWTIEPGTAVWIMEGRYRFDVPDCSYALRAGEFIELTEGAQARALASGSRALYIRTGVAPT
ncbi:cupin domain-containing protein [Kutzneria sp. NPDC052558]|uniref:cupin domain-containing protein n=1 Tax=Kutzneria sp. NPDC052558 TaxID=3364121 RepID=UPI0037C758BC